MTSVYVITFLFLPYTKTLVSYRGEKLDELLENLVPYYARDGSTAYHQRENVHVQLNDSVDMGLKSETKRK